MLSRWNNRFRQSFFFFFLFLFLSFHVCSHECVCDTGSLLIKHEANIDEKHFDSRISDNKKWRKKHSFSTFFPVLFDFVSFQIQNVCILICCCSQDFLTTKKRQNGTRNSRNVRTHFDFDVDGQNGGCRKRRNDFVGGNKKSNQNKNLVCCQLAVMQTSFTACSRRSRFSLSFCAICLLLLFAFIAHMLHELWHLIFTFICNDFPITYCPTRAHTMNTFSLIIFYQGCSVRRRNGKQTQWQQKCRQMNADNENDHQDNVNIRRIKQRKALNVNETKTKREEFVRFFLHLLAMKQKNKNWKKKMIIVWSFMFFYVVFCLCTVELRLKRNHEGRENISVVHCLLFSALCLLRYGNWRCAFDSFFVSSRSLARPTSVHVCT